VSTAEKAWLTVALCIVTTIAARAFGPLAAGSRSFSPRATRVLSLLPAALLAALVVTETVIGPRWRGVSVVWVVIGAAAFTAALRLLF
jgi:branched-subunit amino acid transport protein